MAVDKDEIRFESIDFTKTLSGAESEFLRTRGWSDEQIKTSCAVSVALEAARGKDRGSVPDPAEHLAQLKHEAWLVEDRQRAEVRRRELVAELGASDCIDVLHTQQGSFVMVGPTMKNELELHLKLKNTPDTRLRMARDGVVEIEGIPSDDVRTILDTATYDLVRYPEVSKVREIVKRYPAIRQALHELKARIYDKVLDISAKKG